KNSKSKKIWLDNHLLGLDYIYKHYFPIASKHIPIEILNQAYYVNLAINYQHRLLDIDATKSPNEFKTMFETYLSHRN
ncbi:hypothetical protein NL533_36175, partial [Klebsiella pneumoniae]|nr:hypothetical protein [Klebsiella pneumoniae]